MTPDEFVCHWERYLSPGTHRAFETDLAALLKWEQARERRRLCTDPELYQKACEQTAEEIRRYNVSRASRGKASA